ncbi:AraC family transcriptional regulator [Chitinophaga sp. CF418]|uniref:AraC family transcriptional regulator n=1 Tax=Chitinophaga sp. CF418 TaxID=1855287 RepID=UPI0009167619|nr:AraC family transcriptional regulator [Chitinophaga sp. CF418]SHM85877.1 AraC-type DNA-binding protein [Chitinophaga sp. CF418]
MYTRNLTQQLEIDYVITDKWPLPLHKHTHYELLYIMRGKGQHMINGHGYNYEKGDLFILVPQDNHFFIFQEKTAVCLVKFHEDFFQDFLQDARFKALFTRLSSPYRKLSSTRNNKQHIVPLMELIMAEHRKDTAYQHIIIKNALSLIMALTVKDAGEHNTTAKDDKIQSILNYIHQHIADKHLLSVQKMADTFLISKSYFNQYFKNATGSPYKKYVQEYALKLIAQQLVERNKTVSQLAEEFGYSDESHLNRSFKAYFNQTPSAFKKQQQAL